MSCESQPLLVCGQGADWDSFAAEPHLADKAAGELQVLGSQHPTLFLAFPKFASYRYVPTHIGEGFGEKLHALGTKSQIPNVKMDGRLSLLASRKRSIKTFI